jgi:hypothetical protein
MEQQQQAKTSMNETSSSAGAVGVSVKYECELCLESYNLYDRKPNSLVPCGHSLCIKCFENLNKPVCPYCRASFTSKIPNWEIVKRLPKPTVPIVFYQIEKKLNALKSLASEYGTCVSELNREFNESMDKLQQNEASDEFAQRVAKVNKKFEENHAANVEIEENLTKKLDKFRTQLEADEWKYNEENLKKMKQDVDKLTLNINEKCRLLRREREEMRLIFETTTTTTTTSGGGSNEAATTTTTADNKKDVILTKLENELKETSAYEQIYRDLNAIFNANVIRPISQTSTNQAGDVNNENEEFFNCRPSQKSKPLYGRVCVNVSRLFTTFATFFVKCEFI